MKYRMISPEKDSGKGYLRANKPLEWALGYDEAAVTSFELPRIIGWYPVAFQKVAETYRLVMPFKTPGGKHPLINTVTGKWIGRVLPLALRLYPFSVCQVQNSDEAGRLALTISEDAEQQFLQGSAKPVFDVNGQATTYHDNLISTLEQRIMRLQRDQTWITSLANLDLLVPWDLNFGTKQTLLLRDDLYQIDETRLNALDATTAGSLLGTGAGRLVYGHIYSKIRANMPAAFQDKCLKLESDAPTGSDQLDKELESGLIDFSEDVVDLAQLTAET